MADAHKFFNSHGKKVIFKIRPRCLFHLCCSKTLVKWLDISSHIKQFIWECSAELLFNHSTEQLLYLFSVFYVLQEYSQLQIILLLTYVLSVSSKHMKFLLHRKHFFCCSKATEANSKCYLKTFCRLIKKLADVLQKHI